MQNTTPRTYLSPEELFIRVLKNLRRSRKPEQLWSNEPWILMMAHILKYEPGMVELVVRNFGEGPQLARWNELRLLDEFTQGCQDPGARVWRLIQDAWIGLTDPLRLNDFRSRLYGKKAYGDPVMSDTGLKLFCEVAGRTDCNRGGYRPEDTSAAEQMALALWSFPIFDEFARKILITDLKDAHHAGRSQTR